MTVTAYRSTARPAGGGFGRLLRAEWTKFRTVRGWTIGLLVAVAAIVGVSIMGPAASTISCGDHACVPTAPPLGPDGTPVTDTFYFVHQALTGNGAITVRLTSLTGMYPVNGTRPAGRGPLAGMAAGTQPWTKGGIIVKQNLDQGSAYAAVVRTGGHGTRFQYDYTHDVAGSPTAQWLRLTRSGDTLTGYDSADGTHWTRIGATVQHLPATVQIGLLATSPAYSVVSQSFGANTRRGPSVGTASFTDIDVHGGTGTWTGSEIGTTDGPDLPIGFRGDANGITVTGAGDIAPAIAGTGSASTIERGLVGGFAGLIAVIVVATAFVTAEYRRGLVRVTLAATPGRGRVLAAKAVVAGTVSFCAALAAAAISLPLVRSVLYAKGVAEFPTPLATQVRVVVGMAALLGVAAVLAVAVGAILRSGAAAITAVIAAIVLPYVLTVASVLPDGAAEWLVRVTPAAAFAIEQSGIRYPQVDANYTPVAGFYPLPPWAGFAVLCGYTVVALALATVLLRRRDA